MLRPAIRPGVLLSALVAATLMGSSCAPVDPYAPVPLEWTRMPEYEAGLRPSIRVLAGVNREMPLQVYLVEIDLSDTTVSLSTEPSLGDDRRETPGDLARRSGACVLINGGYYWVDRANRGRQIGLLVKNGVTVAGPLGGIVWQRVRYPVARSTIGAVAGRPPEIVWASGRGDHVVRWPEAFENRLGRPAIAPDTSSAAPWPVEWALSAGPTLVSEGRSYVYLEEEGFFDTYIPRIHPRSAVGLTGDGRALLVVVDGRQLHSRGVSLEELSVILRDLGAVSALNLDGGGSSSLIVNGRLLNRPSGSRTEREIVSGLSVHCSPQP